MIRRKKIFFWSHSVGLFEIWNTWCAASTFVLKFSFARGILLYVWKQKIEKEEILSWGSRNLLRIFIEDRTFESSLFNITGKEQPTYHNSVHPIIKGVLWLETKLSSNALEQINTFQPLKNILQRRHQPHYSFLSRGDSRESRSEHWLSRKSPCNQKLLLIQDISMKTWYPLSSRKR